MRATTADDHKTGADFLKETVAGIKALDAQGQYQNVKFYEISEDQEKPGWKSAGFTSSSTNRFLVSFIHCKVASGYSVKIRATTGKPKNDLLQSFTKAMQELVDHVSKKP